MKKYSDTIFKAVIAYLVKRKSLPYLFYFLIAAFMLQVAAIATDEKVQEIFDHIESQYSDSIISLLVKIGGVIFLRGNYYLAGFEFFFILLVAFLIWGQNRRDTNAIDLEKMIADHKKQIRSVERKTELVRKQKDDIYSEKKELNEVIEKINITLQKENIPKEQILNSISSQIKAIVIFKTYELSDKEIRNNVYAKLGIVNLVGGLSMLPPTKINQALSNTQILEKFKSDFLKLLPENYEYNLSFVSVINLNNCLYLKNLSPFRRFNRTYVDNIDIDDVMTLKEIGNFLTNKVRISQRDLIEVPIISSLIDPSIILHDEYERVIENNEKILKVICKSLKVKEIKMTDLAKIEVSIISKAVKPYVCEPDKIAENIAAKAQFWRDNFDVAEDK